jgi:CRISPR type III-B/RAMP module-associated protein Cmr3
VENYFFGGEKHSKNRKKEKNQPEMDYFTVSELYPQQTTLLGVLRYYLLLKNDCLNPNRKGKLEQANGLIGEKSFEYDPKGTKQGFGAIKSISPLYFVKDNGEKFIVAPADNTFKLVEMYKGSYKMTEYDPKKAPDPCVISLKDPGQTVPFFQKEEKSNEDFVFREKEAVGNKKGVKGKTEEDAFYRQIMYTLNNGWHFAFEAEIDESIFDDYEKEFIPLGAEKQVFLFEIKKIEQETAFTINIDRTKPAIFCISDCFVGEALWDHLLFSVNDCVSFRNLQSSNKTGNYSSLSKGYKRSKRYNLLKRGSILFFENDEKRRKAADLFKNNNAENTGFNKILTI